MYAEKNLFAEEVSPVPVLLSNACNDEFHSMIFYPGRATPIYLVSIAMLAGCGSDSGSGAPDTTVCSTASANTLEEGFSGDFSDDPAMPTRWTLGAGTNELIAGTATGDLDYASFTVGNSLQPAETMWRSSPFSAVQHSLSRRVRRTAESMSSTGFNISALRN
jgi:hypothetical protein